MRAVAESAGWGVFRAKGEEDPRAVRQRLLDRGVPGYVIDAVGARLGRDSGINVRTEGGHGVNPVSEAATGLTRQGLEAARVPEGVARPASELVGGITGGVADAFTLGALSGAAGDNTDFTDPAFLAEAGTASLNASLAKAGGKLPFKDALARRFGLVLPERAANIAAGATEGAAINTAFAGATQAGQGEFDPKGLAVQAGVGAVLGGVTNAGKRPETVARAVDGDIPDIPGALTPLDTPEIVAARAAARGKPRTSEISDAEPVRLPVDEPSQFPSEPAAERRRGATREFVSKWEAENGRPPTREDLRAWVLTQVEGEFQARQGRRADIVLGLPASGKSKVLVNPLEEAYGGRVIDSDIAKEYLPEFNRGKDADSVHQESSDIADKAFNRAMARGDNIVYPLVGKNANRIANDVLAPLRTAGYEVHLHFMELDPQEAARRAVQRWRETGRFVDPDYVINNVGQSPRATYDTLKSRFDSYEAYSNDVPFGERPRHLEQSGTGEAAQSRGSSGHRAGDPGEPYAGGDIGPAGRDRGRGADEGSSSSGPLGGDTGPTAGLTSSSSALHQVPAKGTDLAEQALKDRAETFRSPHGSRYEVGAKGPLADIPAPEGKGARVQKVAAAVNPAADTNPRVVVANRARGSATSLRSGCWWRSAA